MIRCIFILVFCIGFVTAAFISSASAQTPVIDPVMPDHVVAEMDRSVDQLAQALSAAPERSKDLYPAVQEFKPAIRVDAPLNERLQLKYLRRLEMEKKLRGLVRLSLSQSAEYDTNVEDQGDDQKRGDIVYTTRGQVDVNLIRIETPRLPKYFAKGGFNLGATYLFAYDSYRNNDDLNDRDDIFGFNLDIPTLVAPITVFGRRARIAVMENFHPEEFFNRTTDDRDNVFRYVNDAGISVTYPITWKTSFSLPYSNHIVWYKQNDDESGLQNFNSMTQAISPTISWLANAKTSFFIGPRFSMTQYSESSNNYRDFILRAGMFKELTAKVNLGISGGYQVRMFDRPISENGEQSEGGVLADIFYNQRISRRTNFNFTASNAISDSLSGPTNFAGTRDVSEIVDEGNPSVTRTSLNANLTHELSHRVSLRGSSEAVLEDPVGGESQGEMIYSLGLGASYRIRHNMSLNLGYRYSLRNSDVEGSGYTDQLFTLSVHYGIGGGGAIIDIRKGGKAFLDR